MEYLYIGEFVNTHGLKGELRIISDFEYKEAVFIPGRKIYAGRLKTELTITSFRKHKMYDMVFLEGVSSIEDAIVYKGDPIYVNRDDIQIDGYFNEDLIGMNVMMGEKHIGTITDILKTKAHDILVVNDKEKKHMIPKVDEYILKMNFDQKTISVLEVKGLINED